MEAVHLWTFFGMKFCRVLLLWPISKCLRVKGFFFLVHMTPAKACECAACSWSWSKLHCDVFACEHKSAPYYLLGQCVV